MTYKLIGIIPHQPTTPEYVLKGMEEHQGFCLFTLPETTPVCDLEEFERGEHITD